MKLLTLIIAALALLSSCQKDYEPGIPDVPVITDTISAGDSIYLDRISMVYDEGSGVDTQEVFTFRYDSRKRLTELHDSLRLHPGTKPSRDIYFFYNGNDTVPSRTIFIDTEDLATNSTFTDTVYHFYDAAGRKILDSTLNATVYNGGGTRYLSVTRFTYGNNELYGQTVGNGFTGEINYRRDTAVLDARGNILSSKKYQFDPSTSLYELTTTSTFTYDTHPHPFSKLSCFPYFYNFPIGETLFTEYAGFNNQLTQNETSHVSGNTYNWTNVYTYTTAGLPATMTSTYSNGNTDKTFFKYKSL